VTNDVNRRLLEHNSDENIKSYTANRRPVELLWNIQFTDFNQAEELEKQIKGWSRKKKEALINDQWNELKVLAACDNSSSHKNFVSEQSCFRHPDQTPLRHPDQSSFVTLSGVEGSTKAQSGFVDTNSVPFDSAQDDCLLSSWKPFLDSQTTQPYYQDLQAFLQSRKEQGAIIYPPEDEILNAFDLTPLDKVKVVILGQDPYHGEGQAHGLCFSVREGNRIPPSLRNIFKELHTDLGYDIPECGELIAWADQGVFLLNTILTVKEKSPRAHKGKGWETFTDAAIQHISEQRDKVVFILWGAFAHKKENLIDETKHLILKAPHPAAEVYKGGKAGFYGSKPFSKANAFLDEKLNWGL
jgi:uracil-DNA glycosylase